MAHILIIELPGGDDTDILEAALQAGHRFSFVTSNAALYRLQPSVWAWVSQAADIVDIPAFNFEAMEAAVLELHQRNSIEALLCLIDIRLIEAAQLAQRLCLPWIRPEVARLLRDKFQVRQRLEQCALAQPAYALARSDEEVQQAVHRLGVPLLIKPSDGYGSQNVFVLRDEQDAAFWLDPQFRILPSNADYGLGVRANDRLIVERYMEGTLIGCDLMSMNGQHRLLGVHEKRMFEPPYFAIRGSCFSPNGPAYAGVERYACAVLDATGFDWGASHMEIMLTDSGPQLVELNARLVGARIARLTGFALGRSIHQELIDLHRGRPPEPLSAPRAPHYAVTRWVTAPAPGRIERLQPPASHNPLVRCAQMLKQVGDMVRPPFENADRIGYVMTCAPDRAEAENVAEQFVQDVQLTVQAP